MPKTTKQVIGAIGEDIATNYLATKGYELIQRNYLRKWGEIDIVVQKDNVLYFVEVKTVAMNYVISNRIGDWHRPEDNLHKRKLLRIKRAIQSFLYESKRSIDSEWEFSAITIILKRKTRELYKLEHLENLII